MSKNGARKETYLKIHNKLFPECLSNIIGEEIVKSTIKCELRMFKSEKNKNGKSIDLFAITRERGIKVYAEYQVSPSDIYNHFEKKVKLLIKNIQEGIVIWVASEFNQNHINMVKQLLINNPDKQINFFAIQINPMVLDLLDGFNRGYELDVYKQLNMINHIGSPSLSLVDTHLQMSTSYLSVPYKEGVETYDFSIDVDRSKYLLTKLREVIPYYLNFHNEKEFVVNKPLRIAAGRDAIYYDATVYDNSGKAFVRICFGKNYNEWYKIFKSHSKLIREKVSPNIHFSNRNSAISFNMQSNLYNIPYVVENLIYVYERFILFFSPFTYGKRNPNEITNINFHQYNKNLFKNKDDGGIWKMTNEEMGKAIAPEFEKLERKLINNMELEVESLQERFDFLEEHSVVLKEVINRILNRQDKIENALNLLINRFNEYPDRDQTFLNKHATPFRKDYNIN